MDCTVVNQESPESTQKETVTSHIYSISLVGSHSYNDSYTHTLILL